MAKSNDAKVGKPLTIADVARAAGVSLATVSRVMNGNLSVDPSLAERVRVSAAELNYSASPLARSLVSGKTQTVSVIVPDLGNPAFQAMLRGISRAAAHDGYHVLIADSAEEIEEEQVLSETLRRRTDGIILCAPRMSEEALDELLPSLEPAVLINRDGREGAPTVSADYGAGIGELLDHLYELGHRRMLYLAGIRRSASNALRIAALATFRQSHPDAHITESVCGVDFEAGAGAIGTVIESKATAVLAFNDLVAMGLLSALESVGRAVPGDVSVVGFDDIPFAAYTSPPLTTATAPSEELGAEAWSAMQRLLKGGSPDTQITLTTTATVRRSSGPAPGSEPGPSLIRDEHTAPDSSLRA